MEAAVYVKYIPPLTIMILKTVDTGIYVGNATRGPNLKQYVYNKI